ncbi:MAG: hypothetical protein WAM78_23015, partial [Candidatus Sulfotelmatobacter sp.]
MSVMTSFPTLAWTAGGALIASPSSVLREQVLHRLNGRCRPVQQVAGGADALAKLEVGDWQLLFLDRRVPDLDTEELIAIIQRRFPGIQVVLLDSDNATLASDEARSEAGKGEKSEVRPFVSAAPESTAHGCLWKTSDGEAEPLPGMIGRSPAMQQVYRMARLVAPRTTTV